MRRLAPRHHTPALALDGIRGHASQHEADDAWRDGCGARAGSKS